jgi:FkbM family methyltransferase
MILPRSSQDLNFYNLWFWSLYWIAKTIERANTNVSFFLRKFQLLPYVVRSVGDNVVQCKTADGLMLTHKYEGFWWRPETGDPHLYHRFWKARKGNVILDIGAYVGSYALMNSKRVGNSGLILCFEPCPINFNLLKKNIALNCLKNVLAFDFALSNYEGFANMHITDYPAGSFLAGQSRARNGSIKAKVTTIDKFMRNHNFKKVDFIKIDAEGSELSILQGACQTLSKNDNMQLAVASYHYPQEALEVSMCLANYDFKTRVSRDGIVYASKSG